MRRKNRKGKEVKTKHSCTENKLRCCGIVIHTNRRKQFENAPDKLQWHPAFCAAAGLEFHEDIEWLELKPEYNLSKEPIRIDLLIIKEESDRH